MNVGAGVCDGVVGGGEGAHAWRRGGVCAGRRALAGVSVLQLLGARALGAAAAAR